MTKPTAFFLSLLPRRLGLHANSPQDPFRRQRNLADTDTERVGNGVCDGRGHTYVIHEAVDMICCWFSTCRECRATWETVTVLLLGAVMIRSLIVSVSGWALSM